MKKATWLFSLAFVVVAIGMSCSQPPASEPSTAAAGGNTIGVPECDDYLSKVETCIADHVPEDARSMQQQSMEQMRSQWRQAAENPTAKASLAAGCKAALDQARSAFSSYGCQW